jgi:ATP-dependent Clp protease adaptor protein ClpS
MLRVHHERKAVCGTFERRSAEATVAGILAFAGEHNQPLKCIIEEAR